MFLKAGEAHDLVALIEVRMARFDHFSEAEGAHDFAEFDGRHVLRDIRHPDTHGRIDGKIFDASQGLAVFERRNGGLIELEDLGSNEFPGTRSENPLAVSGSHKQRIVKE